MNEFCKQITRCAIYISLISMEENQNNNKRQSLIIRARTDLVTEVKLKVRTQFNRILYTCANVQCICCRLKETNEKKAKFTENHQTTYVDHIICNNSYGIASIPI